MPATPPKPMRPGVGVVLVDADGLVFVGRRTRKVGAEVWQFPQGGLDAGEEPYAGALRELWEETGVRAEHVRLLAVMPEPVEYELPADLPKKPRWARRYRGQRQEWFALRFVGPGSAIDLATAHPEFDAYRWVPLEEAVALAVDFKRDVYRRVADAFRDVVRP